MIIDPSHRKWIAITILLLLISTGLYVPYHLSSLNGPTGNTLVAPSESITPVPARLTCITCFANSHAGCVIIWCAAVMLHDAV